jgi:S1-C subfamily serine protease
MNLLDLLILMLVVLAAVNGHRRGAVLQLIVYIGLLLGLLVGALVAPSVARLFSSPVTQALVALGVLLGLAAVGDSVGWIIGTRAWSAARRSALRPLDSAAGAVVAVTALLLAIWYVGLNLANGPFPALSRQIRGSAIVRGLDDALPEPPTILAEVRGLLNRFGFPEVFAGLPPAPAGPVKGPTKGQAAAATAAADDSTVRIEGQGCGGIVEGSGFVASPNYVITNAHVVAGVRAPKVQQQNGGTESGTVVLFDSKMDIAILRVSSSPGPTLSLDRQEEDRGTGGAVLGYPGGGSLTSVAAAVRRELLAVGRDIYGRSTVRREVYELQASVRPGNSGGPFVLPSGEVAGVVFAASTTDPRVGYALTSLEVMPLLDEAVGRTKAVATGACAR